MQQTVRLKLFFFAIAGLPLSGKTTLVNSLFDTPDKKQTFAINLHEAIIYRQEMFGESYWFESTSIQTQVSSILVAFAQYFAKERTLPSPDQRKTLNFNGLFEDPEIQSYFKKIGEVLLEPVLEINNETRIERILYSSLSLVNVFDVGANKAVYEFTKAIGGRKKHLVFINVIDLYKSDRETLTKPLDLAKYPGQYGASQISLLKERIALHYLVGNMEAASISKPQAPDNTLIVATHADQFESESKRCEREREVKDVLREYCSDMGYKCETFMPKMVYVDATDKESCKKVQDALCKLIDGNEDFKVDLPVRYIFLRYVLSCTKKLYMTREELIRYARKCGFKDDAEVDHFLKVYRECASIFSYSGENHFLHSHVILLPIKFMRDLDKLYCIHENETLSDELKGPAKYGILSEQVFKSLWKGLDDKPMPWWDFNVSVLRSVQLLVEVDHGKFYCPSLRLEHSDRPLRPSSLVISSNNAFTSFSKIQCAFVKSLTSQHDNLRLDEECLYYNCIGFLSKSGEEEGRILVRFFHGFIEVFVDPSNISPSYTDHLYSMLKTDCIAILNQISESAYKLCVVCPKSDKKHHFISFDILDTSAENLHCSMCDSAVADSEVEGIHWVKVAYQGPRKAAVQAEGRLSNEVYCFKEHTYLCD